jgi:multiple sugar transport system ATP-binding protein
VRNPQVFLFDEPLSNLDAKLRVQMRVELKKLHARLETTSIYVTHDQVEAMTLGDRVVVMRDGLIQQVGEPFDLYSHPSNKYVAGFIGSPAMNFAKAQIMFSNDRAIAKQEGFSLEVPISLLAELRPYNMQTVWLGIRPEDLRTARPDDPEGVCFMASVEVAEQLGSEILLDVRCGDAAFVASVEPTLRVRPGDQVKLALAPEKLHFFDHKTEMTIR